MPPSTEDVAAETRSGASAGTSSTWGISPHHGDDIPSVDGIKAEHSDAPTQPAFRLPSDSHLRSHLEKVERGTRQRRESIVQTIPEIDAEDLVRQNELMARAAQARHCERIDFTTGVLDCKFIRCMVWHTADTRRSRWMATQSRQTSPGTSLQSATPCVLYHVSTGVHA